MLGDGCCAFISIALGKNKKEEAEKSLGNLIVVTIVLSILLMIIYLLFSNQIITIFGGKVNEETFNLSKEYFFWITLGIPFYMLGQALNPIIRADGNPKYAMIVTLSGSIVNLLLDPIMIFGLIGLPKMGMAGAAIATIIGQMVTFSLSIGYLFNTKIIKVKRNDFILKSNILFKIISLGFCSFFSQISLVVAMATINNMIKKYSALHEIFYKQEYSQIPMAVVGIVMKFFQIIISIVIGIAAGCIPIVGYNIGANKYKRVKKIFSIILIFETMVGIFGFITIELFPNVIINIFGAKNESVYYTEFAIKAFRTYLALIILACINKATFIFLQAMGKPIISTILAMVREIILGVAIAILLPIFFGLDGVLYSMPLSDLLTFIIAVIIIIRTYKELNKQNTLTT